MNFNSSLKRGEKNLYKVTFITLTWALISDPYDPPVTTELAATKLSVGFTFINSSGMFKILAATCATCQKKYIEMVTKTIITPISDLKVISKLKVLTLKIKAVVNQEIFEYQWLKYKMISEGKFKWEI